MEISGQTISDRTLATVVTINISAASIRAAIDQAISHAMPILSALAVLLQIAIGAVTLYHLLKNRKKDNSNEKDPPTDP